MTREELERRSERAQSETWIIAQTEEGFRIHSPTAGGRPYQVSGVPRAPACTCPDFQKHAQDPEWRCKHILAVLSRLPEEETTENEDVQQPPASPESQDSDNGRAQMLLKRSVSPDGRIDSLSVEFSCPVEESTDGRVEAHADQLLKLQHGIVQRFLEGNGRETPSERRSTPPPTDSVNGATPAQLIRIGGTDGKWGRRLFLTIQANGRTLRLYGSQSRLAEHLATAGYPDWAGSVREGVQLNLPCRIVTESTEDGFLKVEEVLPPEGGVLASP